MNEGYTVAGIDLGTSNSTIGVMKDGIVVMAPDYQGLYVNPSVVSFTAKGMQVGRLAKKNIPREPTNTIFHIKRIMGQSFKDTAVQNEIKLFPFNVSNDVFGRPRISVKYNNEEHFYNPETVSSFIISYLVQLAEAHTGLKIHDVVITCPAYFTENQRNAVKDAGTIAGYNVISVLNEPTAAAIAYGFDNSLTESLILVYDFGGGTFDVSIMRVVNKHYYVLGTDGDCHCGGIDFDQIVINIIKQRLEAQEIQLDPTNKRQNMKIRELAERIKEELSSLTCSIVESDMICGNEEFDISRQEFEDKAMDIINHTLDIVKNVINNVNIKKEDVDEVVLIGGSSRVPRIREELEALFGKEKISERIHPEEAVARGATIRANQIWNSNNIDALFEGDIPNLDSLEALDAIPDNLIISDCIPMSIGIRQYDGTISVLFKKNQRYPCTRIRRYIASDPSIRQLTFQLYQGDSLYYKQDKLICGFFVDFGVDDKGKPERIQLEATYDKNGIITIKAQTSNTNVCKLITVDKQSTNLTSTEVEQFQKLFNDTRRLNDEMRQKAGYRDSIISLYQYVKENFDSLKNDIDENVLTNIIENSASYVQGDDYPLNTLEKEAQTANAWFEYFRKRK